MKNVASISETELAEKQRLFADTEHIVTLSVRISVEHRPKYCGEYCQYKDSGMGGSYCRLFNRELTHSSTCAGLPDRCKECLKAIPVAEAIKKRRDLNLKV